MKIVCEACESKARLELLGPLLADLRHRMADKKQNVRSVARLELCNLYRKHLSAHLTGNPMDEVQVPGDLEWVPKAVLQIYGSEFRVSAIGIRTHAAHSLAYVRRQHIVCQSVPPTRGGWVRPPFCLSWFGTHLWQRDLESRNELEGHIAGKLLPVDSKMRLHALCVLHRSLEPKQRVALKCVLRTKRSSQRQITRWVELHREIKDNKKSDASVKEAKEEQAALVGAMCADYPDSFRAKEVWEHLAQCKDQHVSRNLLLLASPGSSYDEVVTAKDDLRRRMSTRLSSPQLDTLKVIASRPGMSLLWRDGAESLLRSVAEELQSNADFTVEHPVLALMTDFVAVFPEVVSRTGGAAALSEALTNSHTGGNSQRAILCQLLRIVHAVSLQLEEVSTTQPYRTRSCSGRVCVFRISVRYHARPSWLARSEGVAEALSAAYHPHRRCFLRLLRGRVRSSWLCYAKRAVERTKRCDPPHTVTSIPPQPIATHLPRPVLTPPIITLPITTPPHPIPPT